MELKQILQEKISKLLNSGAIDVEAKDVKKELGLVEDVVSDVQEVEEEDELGQYIAERAKKVADGSA